LFSNPTETFVTSGVFSNTLDFLEGAAAETEAAPVLTAGAVTLAALAFLASSSAFLFADSISRLIIAFSTITFLHSLFMPAGLK
jgi:hypothetical protein